MTMSFCALVQREIPRDCEKPARKRSSFRRIVGREGSIGPYKRFLRDFFNLLSPELERGKEFEHRTLVSKDKKLESVVVPRERLFYQEQVVHGIRIVIPPAERKGSWKKLQDRRFRRFNKLNKDFSPA